MKNNTATRDKIYRLKTRQTPLSLMIDTGSAKKKPLIIWDENKKINRAIRYSSNQKSIYIDEQDDNPVLSPIVFEDGFLIVDHRKPALIEFLTKHPKNNQLFELIDDTKDAQEDLEFLDIQDEARDMAKGLTIQQAEMVARVLLSLDVDRMTSQEIKRDVRVYANEYPENFLDLLNDPDIQLENLIVNAFDQKLISFRNQKRDIHWNLPQNKKRLITVPKDVEPNRALISFFISDEGQESLDVLEKLIE